MIDVERLKKDREKDILESLKIIDVMVNWIKKQPNEVWSKRQAKLFNSVYRSINLNYKNKKSKKKSNPNKKA